jgi:TRAP-type C4-dicarboxylate transport system permease small subunit
MRFIAVAAGRLINWLTSAFIFVAAILLAVMAVVGTADVLALNLFGRPVPAATEFASAMLPIAVMLAMAYAQRERAHITVDLFSQMFPPALGRVTLTLSLLIGVIVFSLLSWGAWELAFDSMAINERAVAAVRFPVWPVKLAFAFGASVCTLQLLRELVWTVALGKEPAAVAGTEIEEV